MAKTPPAEVNCKFVKRTKVEGGWRYEQLWIDGWDPGDLITPHPPAVGDTITLWDAHNDHLSGGYVVISRTWMHSSYGSANSPRGELYSNEGPRLTLMVERADGPYIDQVTDEDEA